MKTNITIIGMAGVGKTFTGNYLARKLGYEHIEVDKIIPIEAVKLNINENIVSDYEFIKIEENSVLSLFGKSNSIFDTGGSVIYSPVSMEFLKKNSTIIYLEDNAINIKKRFDERTRNVGEVRLIGLTEGKSFDALLQERIPLYEKYADITINIIGVNDAETILNNVVEKISLISSLS